jgi:hypothetical protein
MDLLVVASRHDPVAALLAEYARARGRTPIVLEHADAARLFTIENGAAGARVEPEVPMLLRPPMPRVPGRDSDTVFLDGECGAVLWAAAALTKAPVLNRPGERGFEGRWSPSGSVTERRADVAVDAELYASGNGGEQPDRRRWALEDPRGRTRIWSGADESEGPFRARPVLDDERYECVVVLGERAWRTTLAEIEQFELERRSVDVVARLGLAFAVVTWGVERGLSSVRLARVDPYPRADQLVPVWGEVAPALLEALGC